MLVYDFVPFIVSNRYVLFRDSNGHNSVTVQNRTHVYMNFFDHKDLGNHLLQLCPKVVKHPVYYINSILIILYYISHYITLRYVMFYYIILHTSYMSHYVTLYYIIFYFIIYIILHYVTLRYVILYYIILY